jgi:hypothetical protein
MDEKKFDIGDYIYYIIIVIACVVAGVVPPLIGSIAGLGLAFPTTVAGWIIWSILQVINAVSGCMILYAFGAQGKDNVKDHPSHLEALRLLRLHKIEDEKLLISPQEWERQVWKKKAIWLGIGLLVGGVALTNAVLAFDVVRFLVQCLTIVMSVSFGLLHMKSTEHMYSVYYLEYAEQRVRIKTEEEINAQTTNYLEITTTSTVERTREIPIKENNNNGNNQPQ